MTTSAKKWVLVGICVLFATLTEAPTEATLIMAFYNGESLYVGSDSLAKTTDGRYVKGQPKIRVGANGLLFSLTGVVSFDVAVGVEGRRLKFDCAEQMQSAFRERPDQPLKVCVTNAVVLFDRAYENFCREATAAGTRELDRTLFIFWGYDDRSKSFLGWSGPARARTRLSTSATTPRQMPANSSSWASRSSSIALSKIITTFQLLSYQTPPGELGIRSCLSSLSRGRR